MRGYKVIFIIMALIGGHRTNAAAEPAAGQSSIDQRAKATIQFLEKLPGQFKISSQDAQFGMQQIKKGYQYLKMIYTNANLAPLKGQSKSQAENQKTYIDAINAVLWALYSQAVAKGQGFIGGAIILQDPTYRVYNFLLDYAKTYNADIAAGKLTKHYVSLDNCYAYVRASTHFEEYYKKAGYEQYGIDMRYWDCKQGPMLPANKIHLLFGKAGDGLTFLKMELYGLYTTDAAGHLQQLVKSRVKEFDQREHVPKDLKTLFDLTVKNLPGCGNAQFIREMYQCAKALSTKYPQAEAFVNLVEKRPGFDHLDIRRGNEVIFTTQEIEQAIQ